MTIMYGTPPTGHEAKKILAASNQKGDDRMRVADRLFTPEGGPTVRAEQRSLPAPTPFFAMKKDEPAKQGASDHTFLPGVGF